MTAVPTEPIHIGDYTLKHKLNHGLFAYVFSAVETRTNEEVAIKMESNYAACLLKREHKNYVWIENQEGFPKLYSFFTTNGHTCLVTEMLGPSLEKLHNICGGKFSLKTVLMLGDQMITRLQYMHSKLHLHRNLKPANFLMGIHDRSNILHVIDFRACRKYFSRTKNAHIPHRTDRRGLGAWRFASIRAYTGHEQSRRDDLESLGYNMLYLHLGNLPWLSMKSLTSKDDFFNQLAQVKLTWIQNLQTILPIEFSKYFDYCYNLSFDAEPDYDYLRSLLSQMFTNNNYSLDYVYDWTPSSEADMCQLTAMLSTFALGDVANEDGITENFDDDK